MGRDRDKFQARKRKAQKLKIEGEKDKVVVMGEKVDEEEVSPVFDRQTTFEKPFCRTVWRECYPC